MQQRIQTTRKWLVRLGLAAFIPSVIWLIAGMLGLVSTEAAAIGDSGIRILAGLSVFGCLMAAVGYWDE